MEQWGPVVYIITRFSSLFFIVVLPMTFLSYLNYDCQIPTHRVEPQLASCPLLLASLAIRFLGSTGSSPATMVGV